MIFTFSDSADGTRSDLISTAASAALIAGGTLAVPVIALGDGNRYSCSTHPKDNFGAHHPRTTLMQFKRHFPLRIILLLFVCLVTASFVPAQTKRVPPKNQKPLPKQQPMPTSPPVEREQIETVKIDTNLVMVPVTATAADGRNVSGLTQDEFAVTEDGVTQQLALFATTRLPVNVVLLLDTSASTKAKLALMQAAAVAFVEKLDTADRVKVISFDSKVRELSGFSNDRATLKAAISSAAAGEGTKLYDAVELALSSLRKLEGRKAIVLFSDGVDWHSDTASDYSTLRWLEEESVVVYPIRYNTRAETERIARKASDEISPELPTSDVIRKDGGTGPTFPSDDPREAPAPGQPRDTGILGLPSPAEIRRRVNGTPRPGEISADRVKTPGTPRKPKEETERRGRHGGDPISEMLDRMYLVADKYLNDLADKSGGTLLRVDDLSTLPDAFAKVAAELQTQYVIGYYPTKKTHDGEYRNIDVTSSHKSVVIRARPGYRAPSGN
ncbi:MAG: Ca-activated chloride channel [Pyrinomonadaceae bacterium]|nr:Ca-activated chloride channel [Pyrinomonadaceae bacterium]